LSTAFDRPTSERSRWGFTLLEALIAMAIMAMMGALIWSSFSPSFQLKEEVEAQADHDTAIRQAVNRMAREISMAYLSNDYDKGRYREMLTVFQGRRNAGNRDRLLFTSFAHQRLYENAPEGDQAFIEYRILEDPLIPGQLNLMRREKTVLDDQPDRGGVEEVLCDDVRGLSFRYWDDQKKQWVEDWDTKDVSRTGQLPFRVEIALLAGPADATPVKYITQTEIFLPLPQDRTQ
jgi:general secretion pathway protein J